MSKTCFPSAAGQRDSDAKLLERMQRGDHQALSVLMERYSAYVYRVVANVLTSSGTTSDAEELVNDVFFSVWSHAGSIAPTNLRAYLAVTARNKAKSFLRKRRALPMDQDMLSLPDPRTPEDHAMEQELKRQLRCAIEKMRPTDRDIFLRYYYYMQTTQQISQLLDIPHSTVRNRLARGRKQLEKLLRKEGLR